MIARVGVARLANALRALAAARRSRRGWLVLSIFGDLELMDLFEEGALLRRGLCWYIWCEYVGEGLTGA